MYERIVSHIQRRYQCERCPLKLAVHTSLGHAIARLAPCTRHPRHWPAPVAAAVALVVVSIGRLQCNALHILNRTLIETLQRGGASTTSNRHFGTPKPLLRPPRLGAEGGILALERGQVGSGLQSQTSDSVGKI